MSAPAKEHFDFETWLISQGAVPVSPETQAKIDEGIKRGEEDPEAAEAWMERYVTVIG